jgi:hypothetical protein
VGCVIFIVAEKAKSVILRKMTGRHDHGAMRGLQCGDSQP